MLLLIIAKELNQARRHIASTSGTTSSGSNIAIVIDGKMLTIDGKIITV